MMMMYSDVLDRNSSGGGLGAAEDQISAWRNKYERLYESHRKLQKTNNSLEDKLLSIVEKFEEDKNHLTRDLASQTQKLVEAKLMLQQLGDGNRDLSSDLHLSITLLRNRPSSYMTQRVDSLPPDMQARVRSYLSSRDRRTEGKRITVAVDTDSQVSAAILGKVLEERDKERRTLHKFCIDVGTQTHGWHFTDQVYPRTSLPHVSNILLAAASVIQEPPIEESANEIFTSQIEGSSSSLDIFSSETSSEEDLNSGVTPMRHSTTCSDIQTDL